MIQAQKFGKYDPFHIRVGSGAATSDVTKLRCQLSVAALDAAAEKQMTGGYSNRRNPICKSCYIRKSNSGECGC